MESYIVNDYKMFFASFPKGDPINDEILKFHIKQYQKYMFENADTVLINGEAINNFERALILCSTKQVEGECRVYGEPDELLFVEDKIHAIEKVKLELPGNLKVKADNYLKFLKVRKRMIASNNLDVKEKHLSLRRIYSFILAKAYHNGHSEIMSMRKKDFLEYVSRLFSYAYEPISSNTVYQTVRSSYKDELNYIHHFEKMKEDHPAEYEKAMKIFKVYYPEVDKSTYE